MVMNKEYIGANGKLDKSLTINEFKKLFKVDKDEWFSELQDGQNNEYGATDMIFEEFDYNGLINAISVELDSNNNITHIIHTEGEEV